MLLSKITKSNPSVKVVVSSTKGMPTSTVQRAQLIIVVDGVVLHFAPNGHSLNYRSCVIHGVAEAVMSPDEKTYAMVRLAFLCRHATLFVEGSEPRGGIVETS